MGPFLVEESQPHEEPKPLPEPSQPARPLNIYELKFLEKAGAPVPESLSLPDIEGGMGKEDTTGKEEGNPMTDDVEVGSGETGDQGQKEEVGEQGVDDDNFATDPEQIRVLKSQPAELLCGPAPPQQPEPPVEDNAPQPSQPDGNGHHILDNLANKILTRAAQDELYLEKGGRKRGRTKGSGKDKGSGKEKESGRGRGRVVDVGVGKRRKHQHFPAKDQGRTQLSRLCSTLMMRHAQTKMVLKLHRLLSLPVHRVANHLPEQGLPA